MAGAIHVARHGFIGRFQVFTMVSHTHGIKTNIRPVSPDLTRYAKEATKDQVNFLVEDPIWAEEFAPNGK